MDKLLLIDGSNLLFQMYYGMPSRITNKDGRAIHGTLGFTGALLKIIRMTVPTHVAVIFDGEHENARSLLNPGYKANRTDYSDMPDECTPFSQLPDIYAALDFLGIRHTETTDCETDDIIAGYVNACGGTETVISSQDSDFFQLITDTTTVLRYRGDKTVICDTAYIQRKFGIHPSRYVDFKSLTGDSSDNLPGAEGIGPKTAAWLLSQYGSLDGVIAAADGSSGMPMISKPSVRDSVKRNADRLKMNYRLIKLAGDAIPPFSLDELVYTDKNVTSNIVLKGTGVI